jgi:hypothetical protein
MRISLPTPRIWTWRWRSSASFQRPGNAYGSTAEGRPGSAMSRSQHPLGLDPGGGRRLRNRLRRGENPAAGLRRGRKSRSGAPEREKTPHPAPEESWATPHRAPEERGAAPPRPRRVERYRLGRVVHPEQLGQLEVEQRLRLGYPGVFPRMRSRTALAVCGCRPGLRRGAPLLSSRRRCCSRTSFRAASGWLPVPGCPGALPVPSLLPSRPWGASWRRTPGGRCMGTR